MEHTRIGIDTRVADSSNVRTAVVKVYSIGMNLAQNCALGTANLQICRSRNIRLNDSTVDKN